MVWQKFKISLMKKNLLMRSLRVQLNKFPYDNFYQDFEIVKKVGNILF
jgi:hypothetical protein